MGLTFRPVGRLAHHGRCFEPATHTTSRYPLRAVCGDVFRRHECATRTVKRVVQELGGKSPNAILPDADLDKAVRAGVVRCFMNTEQSCQAPTRILIERSQREGAVAIAQRTVETVRIGDPLKTTVRPLVSRAQFD
jgi:aldehyde dehydrogenase (NAD+)